MFYPYTYALYAGLERQATLRDTSWDERLAQVGERLFAAARPALEKAARWLASQPAEWGGSLRCIGLEPQCDMPLIG